MFLSFNLLELISKNLNYILYGLIGVIFLIIIILTIQKSTHANKINKQMRLIVEGADNSMKVEQKKGKTKKSGPKKERFKTFRTFYKEYIYFGGSKTKFIQMMLYGYVGFFIVYLLISRKVIPSLILSLLYFLIVYMLIDRKNGKNRKRYMKSFSMSMRVICSSLEAGNTFQQSIRNIIARDVIMERLRQEYIILDNNLRTNMSIEEAMQQFYLRNNMFPEFTMFVTVVQFAIKKGDSGLKEVLVQLQGTLDQKIENYAEIDSEISLYSTVFYILIIAEIGITFLIKLFKPEFFTVMSTGIGPLKLLGSVIMAAVGLIIFKNMVRNAAEA